MRPGSVENATSFLEKKAQAFENSPERLYTSQDWTQSCFKSSLCSEMAAELRFALRCRGSTKPVRRKVPAQASDERFMALGPYTQYGFMGKDTLA